MYSAWQGGFTDWPPSPVRLLEEGRGMERGEEDIVKMMSRDSRREGRTYFLSWAGGSSPASPSSSACSCRRW